MKKILAALLLLIFLLAMSCNQGSNSDIPALIDKKDAAKSAQDITTDNASKKAAELLKEIEKDQ